MEKKEYREYFKTLTPEQLIQVAVNLALDADRLRRELDETNDVIR